MKLAKVYGLMWLLAGLVGGGLYSTNSFDTTSSLVYGFTISVLTGASLLVVFPAMMSERVRGT